MAQLEDLANTAVSKSQIMDAFHPFVLAARRIAALGELREVVGGHVAGDVFAVEARRLELGEPGAGGAHRGLQRLELLVNEEIGADLAREPDRALCVSGLAE